MYSGIWCRVNRKIQTFRRSLLPPPCRYYNYPVFNWLERHDLTLPTMDERSSKPCGYYFPVQHGVISHKTWVLFNRFVNLISRRTRCDDKTAKAMNICKGKGKPFGIRKTITDIFNSAPPLPIGIAATEFPFQGPPTNTPSSKAPRGIANPIPQPPHSIMSLQLSTRNWKGL
jgi:hypothetical protein